MNLANFIDAEDATFIAASRQDIPDLLAEVKRLRELLQQTADILGDLDDERAWAQVAEIKEVLNV